MHPRVLNLYQLASVLNISRQLEGVELKREEEVRGRSITQIILALGRRGHQGIIAIARFRVDFFAGSLNHHFLSSKPTTIISLLMDVAAFSSTEL